MAANQSDLQLQIDPLTYGKYIPKFDGRRQELKPFIDAVEEIIIPVISSSNPTTQAIFVNIIKKNITGKAKAILNINSNTSTWKEIKTILIMNFGSHKSVPELLDDLRSTQFTTTVIDFYNKIMKKLQELNLKSQLEKRSEIAVQTNELVALDVFKRNLTGPMRIILFARDPKTLEEAIGILSVGSYLGHRRSANNHPF